MVHHVNRMLFGTQGSLGPTAFSEISANNVIEAVSLRHGYLEIRGPMSTDSRAQNKRRSLVATLDGAVLKPPRRARFRCGSGVAVGRGRSALHFTSHPSSNDFSFSQSSVSLYQPRHMVSNSSLPASRITPIQRRAVLMAPCGQHEHDRNERTLLCS